MLYDNDLNLVANEKPYFSGQKLSRGCTHEFSLHNLVLYRKYTEDLKLGHKNLDEVHGICVTVNSVDELLDSV